MTQVFILPLAEAEKLSDGVLHRFPQRYARAERIKDAAGRLRCLGAGALLGYALRVDEDQFQTDRYGKPFAPQIPEQFNLSHSGDYVVLAVSDAAVGVDVQQCGGVHNGVARRCFTPDELAWAEENEERFFTVWALKESVAKAVGQGLRLPFNRFCVLPLLSGESIAVEGLTLFGQALRLPGHALAVCANEPLPAAIEPIFVAAREIENALD